MTRRWLIFSVVFLIPLLGRAFGAAGDSAPAAVFAEANAHYQSGDFEAAEQTYRRLLDRGIQNGAVFYNLGNACFKQKKVGEAIYYWEKARRMLPGDSDIRENLQFANLLIVDRIEIPEDPLPVRMITRAAHLFITARKVGPYWPLSIAANLMFAAYWLVRAPRPAFWLMTGSLAAALLMLLFASSLAWKLYKNQHQREAVIVEQKVDVRSGPGGDNITVVTVHEGVIVRVRAESSGWYQVSLPNGWNGWIPVSALKIL
jgi:tetratricopeptide (TPR) repeat protein